MDSLKLSKEINRPSEVIDDDSYVIHPFERHASNLQDVAEMQQRTLCNGSRQTSQKPTSHYQSGSMSDGAISHSSRLS